MSGTNRALERVQVWLARQLIRGTEFSLKKTTESNAVRAAIIGALGLVHHSGHLARVYHVAKKLRAHLNEALRQSEAA